MVVWLCLMSAPRNEKSGNRKMSWRLRKENRHGLMEKFQITTRSLKQRDLFYTFFYNYVLWNVHLEMTSREIGSMCGYWLSSFFLYLLNQIVKLNEAWTTWFENFLLKKKIHDSIRCIIIGFVESFRKYFHCLIITYRRYAVLSCFFFFFFHWNQ